MLTYTPEEVRAQTQARRDQDERKGHRQRYVDGQRNIGSDPVYASPDFRRGYLNGHREGAADRKAGYSSRMIWDEWRRSK